MATVHEAFTAAAELYQANRLHDAERICGQILAAAPKHGGSLNLLGIINVQLGNFQAGCEFFHRAIAVHPQWAEPFGNLGIALKDRGRLDDAATQLTRALELRPDFVEAHNNLGHVFKIQGRHDKAAACYRSALQLAPDAAGIRCDLAHQMQQICEWDGLRELSQRVIADIDRDVDGHISPFAVLSLPAISTARQHWQCAHHWAQAEIRAARAAAGELTFDRPPKRTSKIAVAYLSADFHSHATAQLTAELFEKHDRSQFEITAYSYGPDDGSPMRRRIVAAFDRFVDVRDHTCADAARRIAADAIDILVDLKGYTADARTAILVHRPAPIQVNYLGYPGTMGASFMDYILVDDLIVPAHQQPFYTEKLVHLPGSYQVNDSRREIASQTPARATYGLPEKGFVFCCFNNNYKISADVFDVWMRLLLAVPKSVIWLLEANRFSPAHLRREAVRRGVDAQRLIFAPRCPLEEHLARHRQADVFLDTLPCTAHTTASDALWAGCPLLTVAGDTFASRVAASLLRSLGMHDLIATSLAEYETMALRLASDPHLLSELRARLASNHTVSPLFDAVPFARNLENAYRMMWDIHVSGNAPRSFAMKRNGCLDHNDTDRSE